jgi:hypothetical protein
VRLGRAHRNLRCRPTRPARGAFIVNTCDDGVMLPDMVAEMAGAWRAMGVSLVTPNA